MIFNDGEEPRDTSAAAIAICGILEMDKYFPNAKFRAKAIEMLDALLKEHSARALEYSNGLIMNSMYNRKAGHQPECSIWGDYYTMEALYRTIKPEWKVYW